MAEQTWHPDVAFWRAFRERHPDVDLAVLPPRSGPPDGLRARSPREARLLATSVDTSIGHAFTDAGATPSSTSSVWWEQDTVGVFKYVVRCAVTGLGSSSSETAHTSGVGLLRELAAAMDRRGWAVGAARAEQPTMRATLGGIRVETVAYHSSLALVAESAPVLLSPEAIEEVAR